MKPKVFIDKNNGKIIIIFGKNTKSDDCNVTIVHDRGTKAKNMFGNKISRYIYHCANAYGDSGYSTTTDLWETSEEIEYKLIKKAGKCK